MATVSWDTAASLVVRYRVGVGDVRAGTCKIGSVQYSRAQLAAHLDEELVEAVTEGRVKVVYTAGHLQEEVTLTKPRAPTWSLAVYSLEVTSSGSLSSPRVCRLE